MFERQKSLQKKFLSFKSINVLNQTDGNSLVTNRLVKDTVINKEKFNAKLKFQNFKRVVKSQIDYRRIELDILIFAKFKTEGSYVLASTIRLYLYE